MHRKNNITERMGQCNKSLLTLKIFAVLAITALAIIRLPVTAAASSQQYENSLRENTKIALFSSSRSSFSKTAADVKVMSSEKLTGNLDPATYKITMKYSGEGVLRIGLFEHPTIIFQMPSEFSTLLKNPSLIDSMIVWYNVPIISIAGIELGRYQGSISDLTIDSATNTISVDFKHLLSLNIISSSYEYTLEMKLPSLPASKDGVYTFYAGIQEGLIDISAIEEKTAALNIAVPEVSNPPAKGDKSRDATSIERENTRNEGEPGIGGNDLGPTDEGTGAIDDEDVMDDDALNPTPDSGKKLEEEPADEANFEAASETRETASDTPERKDLPETATDLFTIVLIGTFVIIIGYATRLFHWNIR